MDLIGVHEVDYYEKDYVLECCSQMLNTEWPRSEVLRMRSLESSTNDLPICLALVQRPPDVTEIKSREEEKKVGGSLDVVGHVRMTKIPSIPRGIWIESVIIHPDLRGRGFGKYLMLKAEEFAVRRGFDSAYLCTIDQQVFYSRIGYRFCDPVCAYGGNTRLLSGITSVRQNNYDILDKPVKKKAVCRPVQVPKWMEKNGDSAAENGCAIPPPPPPPPPPPVKEPEPEPEPEKSSEFDELKAKCKKMFAYLTLEDVVEPLLKSPLRCLKEEAQAKAEAKKLDKNSVHRINFPKHYMMKTLVKKLS